MKRQSPTLAKTLARISLGVAACVAATFTAYAAVAFDSATGMGFVGKGDVQLALGLNNKKLQEKANDVEFRASSIVVTEVTWVCTKDNENTQERRRTTTTSTQGIVASVARERNQVTGFILTGYDGDPTIGSPTTDGPQPDSCPNFWELTTPAGAPVLVSSNGGGLQVSINPTDDDDWFDLE
jgi:hypothetical protein